MNVYINLSRKIKWIVGKDGSENYMRLHLINS